jgi:hypothetical protein
MNWAVSFVVVTVCEPGITARDTRALGGGGAGGAVTVMFDVPATGPNWPSMFAVMLTVPAETAVASPAVLIVATDELDDFQVTWLVTSLVLEA